MPVHGQDEQNPSTPEGVTSKPASPDAATAATPLPAASDAAAAATTAPAAAATTAPAAATPAARRAYRQLLTRRNAAFASGALVIVVALLIFAAYLFYRSGRVDRLISDQIISTLAEYGIRAEVEGFESQIGARTAVIRNLKLYDAQTGAELGNIKQLTARIRVADLYALSLRRNVNLERLAVDGLELWVVFDEQGRTNFANIKLPAPDPNRRILFSYSTAEIEVTNSTVHYNDQRYNIAGDARNASLSIIPDNPEAPVESRMNRIALKLSESTFALDGERVEPIDIEARARIDQVRAEIQELVIRSPLAEARLDGVLDDWRALRYRLNVRSSVDLSEVGRVVQAGTAVRGAGAFVGTVEGDGKRYAVTGQIQSDALAAANVRLQGLTVNAQAAGEGSAYEAQGRAVAEILTAGDFRLNFVQLAGNVMGTGTDFRWLGELRAAAARQGATSIGELIIQDVRAELEDKRLSATASRVSARSFASNDLRVGGVRASGINVRQNADDSVSFNAQNATTGAITSGDVRLGSAQVADVRGRRTNDGAITFSAGRAAADGITTNDARIAGAQIANVQGRRAANGALAFSAGSARANAITTADTRIAGAQADNITGTQTGGTTNLQIARLRTGGVQAFGAQIGSLNIAGVRLAIREGGRIEGASGDINAGTVALNAAGRSGQVSDVRLRRPVFTIEPAGRYRVTADLSLGGGVLGELQLGAAQSSIVATNNEVALPNFTANILGGTAQGAARIATGRGGRSVIDAQFENLDIGNLLAFAGGQIVPLRGAATGTADLQFPGTDFARASGNLDVNINGETGSESAGRTPITGRVALRADAGNFQIEAANLQAGVSQLSATGRFAFDGDSDLAVNINSADASELARLAISTGLLPDIEETLNDFRIEPQGELQFNANVRGQLRDPIINGDLRLASFAVGNRSLGSLAATLAVSPSEIKVTNGRLIEVDNGSIAFNAIVPRGSLNNIAVDATFDNFDAASLIAVVPSAAGGLPAFDSQVSGTLRATGLPSNVSGAADLRFSSGTLAGEPFDSIIARATFNGSTLQLDALDARFRAGRVTAQGTADIRRLTFDLAARGEGVRLDLVQNLAGATSSSLPQLSGSADFTARLARTRDANGVYDYQVNLDAAGRDVSINGRPAGALTLTGRTANQRLDLTLTTALLGAPQTLTASVDFSNSNLPVTARIPLNAADLTPLFAALLPPGTQVRVTGRATGEITVAGNLFAEDEEGERVLGARALRGTARFTELGVQIEDVQLNAADPLIVQFSPDEVVFERTQFTGTGTNILFGGTLALGAGGRQNLSVTGDLNLRILNGLSPNVFAAGTAQVAVGVTGSFADPQLTGTASLRDAGVSALVGDDRLVATAIQGEVRFTRNQARIERFTGRLGGGRFSAEGGALLEGFALSQFRFTLRGDNVSLPLPQDIRASADANLVLEGTQARQRITGNVALRRAEYTEDVDLADFIDRRRSASISESSGGGGGGGGASLFGANTLLDIRVEGRDALVVRNNLADAVASVSLQILGTLDEPLIAGRVSAARGSVTFRGERYEITRLFVDLPARADANLLVNLAAEAEIGGYRVFIQLAGELSETARPQVTLRSDPALPQADVVALVTTGQLATDGGEGSTLAGAGVSTATGLLADAIINAPVQRATDRLFGLNVFEINPVSTGRNGVTLEPQLTIGRRVNRNLVVTYTTKLAAEPNQIVAVEYRISDRLSFLAQYEQGSTTSLGARNNEFSFELRFRKRF